MVPAKSLPRSRPSFRKACFGCVLLDNGAAWYFTREEFALTGQTFEWRIPPTELSGDFPRHPPRLTNHPDFPRTIPILALKVPCPRKPFSHWEAGWLVHLTYSCSGLWFCFSFLVTDLLLAPFPWQNNRDSAIMFKRGGLLSLATIVLIWHFSPLALVLRCLKGVTSLHIIFIYLPFIKYGTEYCKEEGCHTLNQIKEG